MLASGAQAVVPLESAAQTVPPQQAASVAAHGSPAPAQLGGVAVGSVSVQIRLPGSPSQVAPVQQSPVAVQGAPTGAQLVWQERMPRASGRQCVRQHSTSSAQGYPSATHCELAGAQRIPGPQVAPLQQSVGFLQTSPMSRH